MEAIKAKAHIHTEGAHALRQFLEGKEWIPADREDYAWLRYERYSFIKFPVFNFGIPDKAEIEKVFRHSAWVLSFADTCRKEDANGIWYVCRQFDPAEIKETFKKSLKKAVRFLHVKSISPEQLVSDGFSAFSDTRKRVGLSDHTREDFIRRYNAKKIPSSNVLIAAYQDDALVAFSSVIIMDGDVEIEGQFARTDALSLCPNDLLVYSVLDHFLNEKKYRLVSYGFSSIQEKATNEGLHAFKTKCGFEAIPVKRYFIFNPKVNFLRSGISAAVLGLLLKLFPRNRALRKLSGIIAHAHDLSGLQ